MTVSSTKIPGNSKNHILKKAAKLFAVRGYNGVSMRELSKSVGLTAAALYHHFPDKKTLYLEVMKYVFADKATAISMALQVEGTPLERLENLINSYTQLVNSDPELRALVVWELLDDDEERLKLVAEEVLIEPFKAMTGLIAELAPGADHYMLTISIIWLVMSHFETAPMCRFLPGWKPEHSDPRNISKHLMGLITTSILP